jgi:ribosome-binding ATPase
MSLKAGIVGLPNVGKSTLFNAITNSKVESENYPFATIAPNVGVVEVPDERLYQLAAIFNPKKTIPTTFEFTDIAGLVKGASQGEGLGNQFLSHIREVDAIVHVVRCFDQEQIIHVEGTIDPIRDIEIIELELGLADLQTIDNRIDKVHRKAKANDKEAIFELALLTRLKATIEKGLPVSALDLNEQEYKVIYGFHLLTAKPVIYVANMDIDQVSYPDQNEYYLKVKEYAESRKAQVIPICAKVEEEIASLDKKEKQELLHELSITHSGLDQIIVSTYQLLNLSTFFTAGEKEVRAWTFIKGSKAPKCAGIIHSDFEKGFIRVEAYSFFDIMKYQNEVLLKEAGKLRVEGKNYEVVDGDVLHFRFNV